MQAFPILTGTAIPFGRAHVDTDIIMPARWLKHVSKTGLGPGAFEALRTDPDNLFDCARNRGAPILIAGPNFGCGSSREHACWALVDLGIRCVIAPDFADIFAGNAVKNGILLVALPQAQVDRLMAIATEEPITVDLQRREVSTASGLRLAFEIDAFRRRCLLEGLDEIDLTLAEAEAIAIFEQARGQSRAWALVAPTVPQVSPRDAQSNPLQSAC